MDEKKNIEEQEIPDWQKRLETMMHEAYLKGLAAGMKTMCGAVLEILKKNTGQNPAKTIIAIKQFCFKSLGTLPNNTASEESTGEASASMENQNEETSV